MKPLLTIALLFLTVTCSWSQRSPEWVMGFRIGVGSVPGPLFALNDWNSLTPSDYNTNGLSFSDSISDDKGFGWGELSMERLSAREWWGCLTPAAGLSFGLGPGASETLMLERRAILPYDTLVSTVDGDYVYLDSVIGQKIRKDYRSYAAAVGTYFLLHANETGYFSFRFGLGVKYAFALQSNVTASYSEESTIVVSGQQLTGLQATDSRSYVEKAPGTSRILIYVPVSLRVCVSKDRRTHALAGFSTGYCWSKVKGYAVTASVPVQFAMGITRQLGAKRTATVVPY